MQKADLLLVRNTGILSARIRALTHCYYNHVGIFVSENEVVEATFRGVYLSPLSKFDELVKKGEAEYCVLRYSGITEEQQNKVCEFVKSQVGHKYDILQLIWLGIYIIFGINRKHSTFP